MRKAIEYIKVRKSNVIMVAIIAILLGVLAYVASKDRSNADALYDANGIKLCDYEVEKLNDGTGRVILHVTSVNDDFEVLACEISCSPDFDSSELFTFGAIAQDGETSYTNEVITPEGEKLYIRGKDEFGNYTPAYVVDLTDEEAENQEETAQEDGEPAIITAVPVDEIEEVPSVETETEPEQPTEDDKEPVDELEEIPVGPEDELIPEEEKPEREPEEKPEVERDEIDPVEPFVERTSVAVDYVTVDGQVLDHETIYGFVGSQYAVEIKNFEGYNFVTVNGAATGTMTKKATKVEVVYEAVKDSSVTVEETGYVYVQYVTEKGKVLANSTIKGTVGTEYATEERTFEGHSLVQVEGNVTGTIATTVTYVNYIYTDTDSNFTDEQNIGYVYVQYVTTDGLHLAETKELAGTVGLEFAVAEKSFEGYTLKEVSGNTTGNYTLDTQYVTFLYEKNAAPEEPEDPEEPEEPHTHNFELVRKSEATCETDGYEKYACECGEVKEEVVPAHGHNYEVYSVTEEAIEKHCANCDSVIIEEFEKFEDEETENTEDDNTDNTDDTNNSTDDTENTDDTDNTDNDSTTEDVEDAETEDTETETEDTETESTDDANKDDASIWDDIIIY